MRKHELPQSLGEKTFYSFTNIFQKHDTNAELKKKSHRNKLMRKKMPQCITLTFKEHNIERYSTD